MIVERTFYFAKEGKSAEVLALRRRASRLRAELGLSPGRIFVAQGESDAPDVTWECRFRSEAAHESDRAARDGSEEFGAVRAEMQTLVSRFERHVTRQVEPASVDLTEVSLEPETHGFPARGGHLTGYLFRPPLRGPLPAVVLNHGSGVTQDSTELSKPAVASVLLSWGIACFYPNRWGYGSSPGAYWRHEVTAPFGSGAYDEQLVRRLHRESGDVVAALEYLSLLDGVDSDRVGVMGSSFGGTVSLLAAAKCDHFKCVVDFAGAAMNWESTPKLRELMKQAARALEAPIFLAQAANDYSVEPTREIARVLEEEGKPHSARIYPRFGVTRDEGHAFERYGAAVWGDDLHRFFERYL